MVKYVPSVPKYNLERIFTRTLIGTVVLAVLAAFVAQIVYKRAEPNYGKKIEQSL